MLVRSKFLRLNSLAFAALACTFYCAVVDSKCVHAVLLRKKKTTEKCLKIFADFLSFYSVFFFLIDGIGSNLMLFLLLLSFYLGDNLIVVSLFDRIWRLFSRTIFSHMITKRCERFNCIQINSTNNIHFNQWIAVCSIPTNNLVVLLF